ncbi:MAG: hypothetical protein M3Y28_02345, partial [Armatimonadota bacterium]|nr:hypothetical protein [Armatimonadota bacterium]
MKLIAALLTLGVALNGPAQSDPPTCRMLRETLAQPRWLCLPLSRLVVNPTYTYAQRPPATASVGDPLTTDMAYYVGAEPVRLPHFLSWQTTDASAVVVGPQLEFTSADWKLSGVTADFTASGARLTPTGNYGSLDRSVTVDLDKTPQVRITVTGTGQWALKVNDGSRPVDVALIADTDETGEFTANVVALTGWHGVKTFTIRLFAIGGPTKSMTFSQLGFSGLVGRKQQPSRIYLWDPHEIVTQGEGDVGVEATTTLPDASTVAQRLRITRPGTGHMRLTGQFRNGMVQWDAVHHTLILQGANFHAALAVSRPAHWLGVRPETSVWTLQFDHLKRGDHIILTARFAPTADGSEVTRQAAQRLATLAAFAAALRQQETAWNTRLFSVPRPRDFTPRAVPALGVTAEEVRRTYYRAWAFLLADTLPPMPENQFPYPQCACGKPSLWAEGAPQSKASAQWESFLAMQSLALVDPQAAWAALEGQLTQIGPDGAINGEGLPSCHMQTAWVLYANTGDRARLQKNYPALKKLLQWKIADPRWILHGSTPPGMKDNEFVVHALTDIGFAIHIAEALNQPKEVVFWRQQHTALAANFHHWFFPIPTGPMYRLYETNGDKRSGPNEAWNLQALA